VAVFVSNSQVMGHMVVPRVLKNTNVKEATHEAPLTGEKQTTTYTSYTSSGRGADEKGSTNNDKGE